MAGYRGSRGYSSVGIFSWELQMSYANAMIFGYLPYVNTLALIEFILL